jgi:uncharacterized protein YdaU (DUF1376 family)
MSSGKAKPATWFRFNVEKWFSMTRNLTSIEANALLTIMCECHQRGEPLPDDPARLAKRCKTSKPAMEKAIGVLLDEDLIARKGGGLWSDYIGGEMSYREERAEQASQNVKKRWQKNQQNQDPPDTGVTKSHRVEELGEDGGENQPPSRSPSSSSSTLGDVLPSTIDRRAPDGAPPITSLLSIGDHISVTNIGDCIVTDASKQWLPRVRLPNSGDEVLVSRFGADWKVVDEDEIPF